MRESRPYGSVRGARGNSRPYRERVGLLREQRLQKRAPVLRAEQGPDQTDYTGYDNKCSNPFIICPRPSGACDYC